MAISLVELKMVEIQNNLDSTQFCPGMNLDEFF